MPTPYQQRQQERHEQKLKEIREQVKSGTLVIRQMTPEERKRFPPRELTTTTPAARGAGSTRRREGR